MTLLLRATRIEPRPAAAIALIAVGWLAFGEAIGPQELISAALVIGAIALSPPAGPAGRRSEKRRIVP